MLSIVVGTGHNTPLGDPYKPLSLDNSSLHSLKQDYYKMWQVSCFVPIKTWQHWWLPRSRNRADPFLSKVLFGHVPFSGLAAPPLPGVPVNVFNLKLEQIGQPARFHTTRDGASTSLNSLRNVAVAGPKWGVCGRYWSELITLVPVSVVLTVAIQIRK
jgi:hypothetical protein